MELTVTGEAVQFSTPAQWADLLDADVQCSTVRLELIGDRQVAYASSC